MDTSCRVVFAGIGGDIRGYRAIKSYKIHTNDCVKHRRRAVIYLILMKRKIFAWSICCVLSFFMAAGMSSDDRLRIVYGSPDKRYRQDDIPAGGDTVWNATGWKGDKVQTQVLIWSKDLLRDVRLVAEPLRNSAGGAIPAAGVHYGFVRYVLTDGLNKDGGGCGLAASVQADSSLVADRIDREAKMTIAAGKQQPIWLSIDMPRGIAAGLYSGSIQVIGQGFSRTLYYHVNVQDHVLPAPADWSYHLDLWQNPYSIARVHGVKPWSEAHFRAMRPYMKMLADAGQKTITVSMIHDPWRGQTYDIYGSMIKWVKKADGKWSYDYTIFDKWVQFMMDQGIDGLINCYTMVAWNNKYYYYDAASGKDSSLTAEPGGPEYNSHWRSMLSDFRAHLKKKGWYGKTSIAMDERALEDMKRVIALVKSVDTAFKISLAGSYHREIEEDIYDYSITSAEAFDTDVLAKRLQKHWPTTYYTCCVEGRPNTFTFSPPAEAAWLGWYTAAKAFNGYLRWAYNCWPAKPFEDSRFGSWSAGDTYLVYPGAETSIRFERLVQGIREYEKIRVLEALFSGTGQQEKLQRLRDLLQGFDIQRLSTESAASQLIHARSAFEQLGEESH
jgi:hypothetical protein